MSGLGLILPNPAKQPGWIATYYYGYDTQHATTGFVAAALSAGAIYAMPCEVPDAVPIDRIGAEITTGSAGKSFRCALYLPDGVRRRPGTLLLDSGNLAADTPAFVEAAVNLTIPAGLIWMCINAEDATMAFRQVATGSRRPLFGKTAGGGTVTGGGIVVAQAFGAYPASFPAGAVPVGASPIVNVRAA